MCPATLQEEPTENAGGSAVAPDTATLPIWLRSMAATDDVAVRLLCIPHAGAGASTYNSWHRKLPDWIQLVKVQLPGREDLLDIPACTEIDQVIPSLAEQVEPLLDKPLIIYGHCMGALVAFELARELRRRNRPLPHALWVSGRVAPQIHPRRTLHDLSETELLAALEHMGASSPILRSPKWRAYYLPTLRADLRIPDIYMYSAEPALSCPLHALVGAQDVQLDIVPWREQTDVQFEQYILPGEHFFSSAGIAQLIELLVASVEKFHIR